MLEVPVTYIEKSPSSRSRLPGSKSGSKQYWLPIAVVMTIIAGLICSWLTVLKTDKMLRADLIQNAKLIAEAVKIDHIRSLAGAPSDIDLPQYHRLKEQLSIARAEIPRCRFLYITGRSNDGKVFFFVDSEPSGSEFSSPPGQEYDEASDFFRSVFDKKTDLVEGPLPDRWGVWVSGFVPLIDPVNDELVAVFGMDIDAKEWRRSLIQAAIPPVLFTLVLIAISVVSSVLFSMRNRLEKEGRRRYRHLEVWLSLSIGLLLTLYVAREVHLAECRSYFEVFRQYADTKTSVVANTIRFIQDVELEGLARFYEYSEIVDAPEFKGFASHLTRNPIVQAWEWVPEVTQAKKAEFEATARTNGLSDFEIWQLDQVGDRQPVPDREAYYPVYRVIPFRGNEKIIGFDAGSEAIRNSTLHNAKETGLVCCTEPLTLVQDSYTKKALIVFRPTFKNSEDRMFIGFATAVIQLSDVLTIARPNTTVLLTFSIGKSSQDPDTVTTSETAHASTRRMVLIRPVFAFGKVFFVTAYAGPTFYRLHPDRAGWLTLFIGLILSLTISAAFLVSSSRREELESLVTEKIRSLRESEEKLSATLRSIGDGVISCDRNSMVIGLNPVAEIITGWSSEDAIGKHVTEVFRIVSEDGSGDLVSFALCAGEAKSSEDSTTLVSRSGQKSRLSMSCAPIRDDSDDIIGAVLVFRDVTEDHQRRAELNEERRRLEYILGVTKTGINITDEDFNLQYVDREWQKVYGDPIGRKCYEYFMGAYEPCPSCPILYVFESKKTIIQEQVLPAENNRIVEVHTIPFQDDNGRWLVAEFNVDITERKNAEVEREKLMAAIEQAGEMVVVTDSNGVIQYVNPAFERVTQFTREDVYGKTPSYWKSGQQSEQFYKEQWEIISSGQTWQGRLVNKRKDGSLYTGEATISPVCDNAGNTVSFIAVMRDITDNLRLAEQYQQSQKMESVGRLAGGIAHDFNNMLSVILGRAELLLSKVTGSENLEFNVREIQKAANRSAELTRQLLAYARKQTINPVILDLNSTIANMLTMLQRIIGEDIDLLWKPKSDLWPVKMDPSQIDQILVNLVVNSRDAISANGKITIETSTLTVDNEYCINHPDATLGDYVMLAVSDNGCGMDTETKKRLFEPFFTTKDVGKGTGLGLATIYGIIKQNNGFVNVYSELGIGTTFRLYFPRAHNSVRINEIDSYYYIYKGTGQTILIVEDEPSILNLSVSLLEEFGYRPLKANSPEEAIQIMERLSGDIDLLLTDIVMPNMNGKDLYNTLKSKYSGIKCLFMSGYTADVIANHGILDEGVNFIQKPFHMKDLLAKVRIALET